MRLDPTPSNDPFPASRRVILDAIASGGLPAYATDQDDRIVFWNKGAEGLFGKDADDVLGKPAHKVVGKRDWFGYRRRTEPADPFSISTLGMALFLIPGRRRHLYTLVHVLQSAAQTCRPDGAGPLQNLSPLKESCLPPVPFPAIGLPPLTQREREILDLLAEGLQNKEVAQEIRISSVTVRNHVQNILAKLGVHSKLEAVSMAFRRGWVRPAPARDRARFEEDSRPTRPGPVVSSLFPRSERAAATVS